MKATGIVRRIDELGRVVIPKEIRRTLRIKEGDALEIFTNRENELILKKYSPLNEMNEFSDACAEALHEAAGISVLITDNDMFVSASSDQKNEYLGAMFSPELDKLVAAGRKQSFSAKDGNIIPLKKGDDNKFAAQIFMPITVSSERFGMIVAVTNAPEGFSASDATLLNATALYLAKQLA